MNKEPNKPYVYQPMPPKEDGKFYGVGGLHSLGLGFDEAELRGIEKETAEYVVRTCNAEPDLAACFVREFKKSIAHGNLISACGCRFENSHSNGVLLCDLCSQLPCHSGDTHA